MPSDAHFSRSRPPPETLGSSSTAQRVNALGGGGGVLGSDLSLSNTFQFPPTFMDIERYNREKEERTEEEERLGYDPTFERWLPSLDQDCELSLITASAVTLATQTSDLSYLLLCRCGSARASDPCIN